MAKPIQDLHALGQSLWYDNIQRQMLENGELARLIALGELRGMTSNPSIFNQAIAKSTDYDAALTAMAWAGWPAGEILDQLMIEDIRLAADIFLPLYQETNGGDGFVSVEVSPALARDTAGTLAEARRLWDTIARPNLMVKIPGTQEGLPAIRQAIAAGLNINITLIFSIARYLEVMEAYLSGLEDRLQAGLPLDHIASVASFFVSRIDSNVDKRLEAIVRQEGPAAKAAASLQGRIAIANARLAYDQFKDVFESARFQKLAQAGARLQRPLWASTSTKNPAFPDTLYVDELIGPNTVNTVPPQTLDAFRDHGTALLTIEENLNQARLAFAALEEMGISIDEVTAQLEVEGVKAFADAFTELTKTVETRRAEAVKQLGPLAGPAAQRVKDLAARSAAEKIWSVDPSLWTANPDGQKEARKRMGWLTLPEKAAEWIPDLQAFAQEIFAEGYTHALLLGMGGSSLAPEVLRLIFRPGAPQTGPDGKAEWLDLLVVDSTDPGQVLAAARRAPVDKTLYIVSSKSGGTAEVNALLAYFWKQANRVAGERAGEHFVAITDPGTSLETLARQRGFRRIFSGDPEVGGRYSALSPFGLLPAALLGLDLERLLARAASMEAQTKPGVPAGRNPALVLGAVVGEAALQGRDKLTFISDPDLSPFVAWLEQLVAESSGKEGKGIVPVDGEIVGGSEVYGQDRIFVRLTRSDEPDAQTAALLEAGFPVLTFRIKDSYDLGAEFYRWEFATPVACAVLGVNPFDQPNVQDNKKRTLDKIESYHQAGRLDEGEPAWEGEGVRVYGTSLPGTPGSLKEALAAFLAQARSGDYVALNAYLPRSPEMQALLKELQAAVRNRTHLATTVGFGPRFLHSTGQLHKGGTNNGLFLQFTASPVEDVEIPGQDMMFSTLELAQALGDLDSLQANNRRALRIHLQRPENLKKVLQAI